MYARGGEQLKTIHGWGPRVNGVRTENKRKKYIYVYILYILNNSDNRINNNDSNK